MMLIGDQPLSYLSYRDIAGGHELRQKNRPGRLIEPHALILSGVTSLATRSNV
jgi:hypothetical protein